jgi:hypothetical protein
MGTDDTAESKDNDTLLLRLNNDCKHKKNEMGADVAKDLLTMCNIFTPAKNDAMNPVLRKGEGGLASTIYLQ